MLWTPDAKSRHIEKDPDAGRDRGQEEKRATEGKMVGWHHRLNGQKFEQILGGSEGQGSLVCCSPWDCKESDTAERLNNSNSVKEAYFRVTNSLFPQNRSHSCSF